MTTIKCHGVRYRQGFLEVVPGIHAEHINLEMWNVHPDQDLSGVSMKWASLPDDAIMANTEIELNLKQAKELLDLLQAAIQQLERAPSS